VNWRVNEKFFDQWNEASAYVFGFWWADGSIYIRHRKNGKRSHARISFSGKDVDHLEMIIDLMKLKKKIQIISSNPKSYGRGSSYGFVRFGSNHMVNKLISFGGTRKKSFKYSYPKIPNKYFHHFVRGYFDGDGSIYYKHYNNRHGRRISALGTSFTAGNDTGNFLEDFKQKLREFIPVGNKKIANGKAQKLIFNQYDSMLLCEWMYKDATIFMKRKKKIWDETDKEKLKNSRKFFKKAA